MVAEAEVEDAVSEEAADAVWDPAEREWDPVDTASAPNVGPEFPISREYPAWR